MVILPVDQGFEHGPARSFAPNASGYDPRYHFELAIDAGCSAYAAPLGFLEAGAAEFAGDVPLILKLNNSDSLSLRLGSMPGRHRLGAAMPCAWAVRRSDTRSIRRRLRAQRDVRGPARARPPRRRAHGLAVVVWSYPRGSGISKEGETAIDVVAYAAQIAAQLGAHVVKVKPPTEHMWSRTPPARSTKRYGIPIATPVGPRPTRRSRAASTAAGS